MLKVFIGVNLLEISTQRLALASVLLFWQVSVLNLTLLAQNVSSIVSQIIFDDHVFDSFHILLHVSMDIKEECIWMEVAFLLRNSNVLWLWISLTWLWSCSNAIDVDSLWVYWQETISSRVRSTCPTIGDAKHLSCSWKSSLGLCGSSSISIGTNSLSILTLRSHRRLSWCWRISLLPYSLCLSVQIWAKICDYMGI